MGAEGSGWLGAQDQGRSASQGQWARGTGSVGDSVGEGEGGRARERKSERARAAAGEGLRPELLDALPALNAPTGVTTIMTTRSTALMTTHSTTET